MTLVQIAVLQFKITQTQLLFLQEKSFTVDRKATGEMSQVQNNSRKRDTSKQSLSSLVFATSSIYFSMAKLGNYTCLYCVAPDYSKTQLKKYFIHIELASKQKLADSLSRTVLKMESRRKCNAKHAQIHAKVFQSYYSSIFFRYAKLTSRSDLKNFNFPKFVSVRRNLQKYECTNNGVGGFVRRASIKTI